MEPLSILLLGSTGSIGESTLQIVREHPGRFRVEELVAGSNREALENQVREFAPRRIALADQEAARRFKKQSGPGGPELLVGEEGIVELCETSRADRMVNAAVGASGLRPTLAALGRIPRICLANKETLVAAGEIVMKSARESGTEIIPVDSEHSAIHQCLQGIPREHVRRLVLTASGGPFRTWTAEEIAGATLRDALNHPTWNMGPKITVDSATLMNKGLEVIEAMHLFDVSADEIDVVVHPQSVIHSFVETTDGSYLAQLGEPDMRHPIRYALTFPDRLSVEGNFQPTGMVDLTFEEPDHDRFPCLGLAFRAAGTGGVAPAVLNAANEVAVEAFLKEKIPFSRIAGIIEATLAKVPDCQVPTIDDIFRADKQAREEARLLVAVDIPVEKRS